QVPVPQSPAGSTQTDGVNWLAKTPKVTELGCSRVKSSTAPGPDTAPPSNIWPQLVVSTMPPGGKGRGEPQVCASVAPANDPNRQAAARRQVIECTRVISHPLRPRRGMRSILQPVHKDTPIACGCQPAAAMPFRYRRPVRFAAQRAGTRVARCAEVRILPKCTSP